METKEVDTANMPKKQKIEQENQLVQLKGAIQTGR